MIPIGASYALTALLAAATPVAIRPANAHLRPDGARFVKPDGTTFQWRGITAFRLLDYLSEGDEAGARKYFAWVRSRGLTVVRVLAMLDDGFFDLSHASGRAALPDLLTLARSEGIYVEVVGLTETAKRTIDPRKQIAAIARIVQQHPNALLELANEPNHPSQSADVHRPEFLKSIAASVPDEIPVALGSSESNEGFAAGDYITWHAPRESDYDGWGHVLTIAAGANLVPRFRKPVISDEPIGAGPTFQPGRRDNDPDRFRAAALLTRLAGMGATFHYDSGLHTRVPEGAELACFEAWNEAWRLLPDDIEHRGEFRRAGDPGAAVRAFDAGTALGVFERQDAGRAWVLVVRPAKKVLLQWADGWSATASKRAGGVELIEAARTPAGR